jgi:hypothetical protein
MKSIFLAIAVAAPVGLCLASPGARADTDVGVDSISANPTTTIECAPTTYIEKDMAGIGRAARCIMG